MQRFTQDTMFPLVINLKQVLNLHDILEILSFTVKRDDVALRRALM